MLLDLPTKNIHSAPHTISKCFGQNYIDSVSARYFAVGTRNSSSIVPHRRYLIGKTIDDVSMCAIWTSDSQRCRVSGDALSCVCYSESHSMWNRSMFSQLWSRWSRCFWDVQVFPVHFSRSSKIAGCLIISTNTENHSKSRHHNWRPLFTELHPVSTFCQNRKKKSKDNNNNNQLETEWTIFHLTVLSSAMLPNVIPWFDSAHILSVSTSYPCPFFRIYTSMPSILSVSLLELTHTFAIKFQIIHRSHCLAELRI